MDKHLIGYTLYSNVDNRIMTVGDRWVSAANIEKAEDKLLKKLKAECPHLTAAVYEY